MNDALLVSLIVIGCGYLFRNIWDNKWAQVIGALLYATGGLMLGFTLFGAAYLKWAY